MLFKTLDRLKRSILMTTIILIFIGSALLLIPSGYISFMGSSLAFILMVACVSGILRFMSSRKALIHYINLFLSLTAGLIGLILFINPEALVGILRIVVGILPIVLGTSGNYYAFIYAQRAGRKAWWILAVLSSLLIFFGAFSLFQPWMSSISGIAKVAGGGMMFSAFVFALTLIWVWPLNVN